MYLQFRRNTIVIINRIGNFFLFTGSVLLLNQIVVYNKTFEIYFKNHKKYFGKFLNKEELNDLYTNSKQRSNEHMRVILTVYMQVFFNFKLNIINNDIDISKDVKLLSLLSNKKNIEKYKEDSDLIALYNYKKNTDKEIKEKKKASKLSIEKKGTNEIIMNKL